MSNRTHRLSRRNFLLAVGAGGAATAAAIVASESSSTTPPGTGTNKRGTRGYHATAHVNNYYRTTKV